MSAVPRVFCIALLLLSLPARGEFNDEQFQTLDGYVGFALSQLQEDAKSRIDSALSALADAYQGSGYSSNPAAEEVRSRLAAEGQRLKGKIAEQSKEIVEGRKRARDPAIMIVLLSKEQAVSFDIYRWLRGVIEMTDLAHASSRRSNPNTGEFLTKLMQAHEKMQETIATCIQGIATKFLAGRSP